MARSDRLIQLLFLLAAIISKQVKTGKSPELFRCGQDDQAFGKNEFRRLFQYKDEMYLVFRTKIVVMSLPERDLLSENDSIVINHPRIMDNSEQTMSSIDIPEELVIAFSQIHKN